MLTAHPAPPAHPSLPVGSCCEKLCDQELATSARGSKYPSAALSQGACLSTYLSWPLEVAVTLSGVSSPFPEVPRGTERCF